MEQDKQKKSPSTDKVIRTQDSGQGIRLLMSDVRCRKEHRYSWERRSADVNRLFR